MRIALIIQARTSSTRLPNKVFRPLAGKMVIDHLIDTCKEIPNTHTMLTVPCTQYKEFCARLTHQMIDIAYGHDENDLLNRYDRAFKISDCDAFIRLTGDCPLVPRFIIETTIKALETHDYVTNTINRTFPDGFDCQGISKKGWECYKSVMDKEEHLFQELETGFLKNFIDRKYSVHHIISGEKVILNPYHPDAKLSIDTEEDLERVEKYIESIRPKS